MRQYLWQLDDVIHLDPTNENGLVDLELSYMFGLYKANTILARINEPSPGMDVNVISEVRGSDVTFVSERDIMANGE